MTYVINDEMCKQKGMKVEELLLLLLIKDRVDINSTLQRMLKKEMFIEQPVGNYPYMVTQRWNNVAEDILLSADTSIPTVKELESLATEMAHLFPNGVKEGTKTYWKGNRKDNVQKLQKFFKLYGHYTKEKILEATKVYVDKYKNDHTTMRVLKYFILKDSESDLATTLENMDQTDSAKQLEIDWNVELK